MGDAIVFKWDIKHGATCTSQYGRERGEIDLMGWRISSYIAILSSYRGRLAQCTISQRYQRRLISARRHLFGILDSHARNDYNQSIYVLLTSFLRG